MAASWTVADIVNAFVNNLINVTEARNALQKLGVL